MKNRNLSLFINLIPKAQSRSELEMRTSFQMSLHLFRLKIKFSSLVERRKKTTLDRCFRMNAILSMSKHTKLRRRPLWIIQGVDINWLTFIENLSLRPKISFMRLVASILMRQVKLVRFMTFPKTNGPTSVTSNNQDTTTPSPSLTADISTWLVVETLSMKHHLNLSKDLTVSSISVNKSGNSFSMWTSITCGLQETPSVLLLLTIQRFLSSVEITDGYPIASISTLRPMKSTEWTNARWKSQKNSSDLNLWNIMKKFSSLVVLTKMFMFSVLKHKSGSCLKSGMLIGDWLLYVFCQNLNN